MSDALVEICVFSDKVEAASAAELLERNDISCVLHHEHETFNPAFTLKSTFAKEVVRLCAGLAQ